MTINEFKSVLTNITEINFILPNGYFVPKNFHITEVGITTKNFIDCGGTVRSESKANFQLWVEESDIDHRLSTEKLLNIIVISEEHFDLGDLEVEVEYQIETINKFNIGIKNKDFTLIPQQTDCLAKDQCGIPVEKPRVKIVNGTSSCEPGSGCC